tara:strand:+ start:3333 stop:3878 length:546 start_codon:yes stop_codon:yes gene_type:complete
MDKKTLDEALKLMEEDMEKPDGHFAKMIEEMKTKNKSYSDFFNSKRFSDIIFDIKKLNIETITDDPHDSSIGTIFTNREEQRLFFNSIHHQFSNESFSCHDDMFPSQVFYFDHFSCKTVYGQGSFSVLTLTDNPVILKNKVILGEKEDTFGYFELFFKNNTRKRFPFGDRELLLNHMLNNQ